MSTSTKRWTCTKCGINDEYPHDVCPLCNGPIIWTEMPSVPVHSVHSGYTENLGADTLIRPAHSTASDYHNYSGTTHQHQAGHERVERNTTLQNQAGHERVEEWLDGVRDQRSRSTQQNPIRTMRHRTSTQQQSTDARRNTKSARGKKDRGDGCWIL